MTITGSTTGLRTLSTPEEMRGVRRDKPLNTALNTDDATDVRHGAPRVTNLNAGKLPLRTHITPQDLQNLSVKHNGNVSEHDQLVKQTQKWVAQAFYGTMLKQMRDSPFRSDLFEGGKGGQAFGTMYDQELAQRMARGAGSKLVDTIVRHIEQRSSQTQQRIQVSPQAQMRQQMQQSQAQTAQAMVQMPTFTTEAR